jgi:riboflavin kinase / FMN adenylyltransferase
MHLFRGLRNCKADDRGMAVAIGNFDGVHLGHQALVRAARQCSLASGARLAVLSFEPHPREYFDPDSAPPRLMRLGEKCVALDALGVERLVVLRFDAHLQHLSPEDFVEQALRQGLGARHVVVGEGFRFGCRRAGTIETLAALGARAGFEVIAVPSVTADGARVSSTRVRAALGAGDLAGAERLLGRPYAMSGRVIYGQQLGRRLGFATANLRLHRRVAPLGGVFAVEVRGIDGCAAAAVASLGNRPTVGGGETLLEVHVFDFDGNLYGRRLSVDFVAKLRDEAKFPSLDAMVTQMHADAARAREILAARAA